MSTISVTPSLSTKGSLVIKFNFVKLSVFQKHALARNLVNWLNGFLNLLQGSKLKKQLYKPDKRYYYYRFAHPLSKTKLQFSSQYVDFWANIILGVYAIDCSFYTKIGLTNFSAESASMTRRAD